MTKTTKNTSYKPWKDTRYWLELNLIAAEQAAKKFGLKFDKEALISAYPQGCSDEVPVLMPKLDVSDKELLQVMGDFAAEQMQSSTGIRTEFTLSRSIRKRSVDVTEAVMPGESGLHWVLVTLNPFPRFSIVDTYEHIAEGMSVRLAGAEMLMMLAVHPDSFTHCVLGAYRINPLQHKSIELRVDLRNDMQVVSLKSSNDVEQRQYAPIPMVRYLRSR